MATSLFTQPTSGSATSDNEVAFRVDNGGGAAAIWAENASPANAALVGVNRGNAAGAWVENVSNDNAALVGINRGNAVGVYGESNTGEGVRGVTSSDQHAAIVGVSNRNGFAIHGKGARAGFFEGDVEVTGDIRLLGADCAEEFDVNGGINIDPGTVMVLDQHGNLQQSHSPYDKKVAGVVSGAGIYKPAVILDRKETGIDKKRLPVALIGKVYCKVDASKVSIEIGDLLTTSSLEGHAMKAEDPYKAFGSVIGKALGSLKEGVGMIPVLVALQ